MNRRGFMGAILAACVAPAIVRADSLMKIIPRETLVLHGGYTAAVLNEQWAAVIEEVQIGDALWLPTGTGAAALEKFRRTALEIVGHSNVETMLFDKADKSDPLNQHDVLAWKADKPLVGWRDRAARAKAQLALEPEGRWFRRGAA